MSSGTLSSSFPSASALSTSISTSSPPFITDLSSPPTPTISSDCPINTLVIQLSTSLVIPNFSQYYAPTPITSFVPTYTSRPDGSLIAPPFNQDLADANLSLLVTGALATIFARNIVVSGDYVRRGKVKKKNLFYILFLSQIISPVAFVPFIWSYFSQRLDCTIVIVLSCVSGGFSLALLITVILGVKVYKCLNNSRLVPVILGLLQAAAFVVIAFDVIATRAERRLSGSCIRSDDLRFTRYYVSIQFLQSLFICGCLVYVCWKSRGSPAVRGRISIELSMDELPIEVPNDPPEKVQPVRRGWWDYVPDPEVPAQAPPAPKNSKNVLFRAFRPGNKQPSPKAKTSKSRPKASAEDNANFSRISLAPSSTSKLSRLFPRMELFQQVIKDELLYTTFITSTCVIVAVLAIIGVNFKNGLSVTGWIALNWGLISLLTVHSFGRVVHRHEREALLQHPVTCSAIRQAANDISRREVSANRDSLNSLPGRRSIRAASIGSINVVEDPFADSQAGVEKSSAPSVLDDQDFGSTVTIVHRDRSYVNGSLVHRYEDLDVPTSPLGTPIIIIDAPEVLQKESFTRSWQTVTPGFTPDFLQHRDSSSVQSFKS